VGQEDEDSDDLDDVFEEELNFSKKPGIKDAYQETDILFG